MKDIIIVGASGHARVVIDIVRKQGKYNILGLVDRDKAEGEETLGCKILGDEQALPFICERNDIAGIIIAVGDNYTRYLVSERIRKLAPKTPFVSAVHPDASIGSDVTIGSGTVIMAGARINPSSSIGDNCIVNTNSSLDHNSKIGDFASLAPGVVTGGACSIGPFTAIGIGAVLVHNINIGEHTVIGAASLVTRNIGPNVVAYGVPARDVRSRNPGDRYL